MMLQTADSTRGQWPFRLPSNRAMDMEPQQNTFGPQLKLTRYAKFRP